MAIELSGARILITGASAGIGQATARALSRAGARIAVGARRRDRLEALAAELAPATVIPFELDVSDRASCERFVEEATAALGGVDVLVNNAGLGQWMAVRDTTPELFDRLLKTNVYGPYWLTRAVLPRMEAQGPSGGRPAAGRGPGRSTDTRFARKAAILFGSALRAPRRGAIVQVSSALAHRALPNMATYCATKAFLDRFSEGLRVEARRRGVDVIVVSPGIVESEFATAALRPGGGGERGRPRGASPDTVAAAIVAGLEARRPPRELFPQRQGRLFRALNPHLPGLFDRAFARMAEP